MKKRFSALATAVIVGAIMAAGSAAYADATTINLSTNVTADGSTGISSGAGFTPSSVAPGSTTTLQMGTTTPANSCRTTGDCAPGYPNNGAVLTFTGLAAAGLTFVSNGDTSAGCVQQDADTVVCHYQYFNNYHKSDHFVFTVSPTATPGNYTINVALHVFDKTLPTSKDQCKNGGWSSFNDALDNPVFKNQGDCVSYVATGGNA